MKTLFTKSFLLILILVSFSSFAQTFKPGLIIGLVATDLVGSDLKDGDNDLSKAGFTAGGSLNTKLSTKNSLQFEILYTQKGTLQKGDSLGNGYYKLSLNYVEVPLMFRHKMVFNVAKKSITNFNFEIGPSYGRLVQVKQEGGYGFSTFYQNNFKPNEFALNAGIGCRIFQNLYANIRYSNSIVSVVYQNTPVTSSFWWAEITKGDNMVWSFTLRYVFSKEKEKNKERAKKEDADSEN